MTLEHKARNARAMSRNFANYEGGPDRREGRRATRASYFIAAKEGLIRAARRAKGARRAARRKKGFRKNAPGSSIDQGSKMYVECPSYCVTGLACSLRSLPNFRQLHIRIIVGLPSPPLLPRAPHSSDRKTNRAFAVAHFISRRPRCSHAARNNCS